MDAFDGGGAQENRRLGQCTARPPKPPTLELGERRVGERVELELGLVLLEAVAEVPRREPRVEEREGRLLVCALDGEDGDADLTRLPEAVRAADGLPVRARVEARLEEDEHLTSAAV